MPVDEELFIRYAEYWDEPECPVFLWKSKDGTYYIEMRRLKEVKLLRITHDKIMFRPEPIEITQARWRKHFGI